MSDGFSKDTLEHRCAAGHYWREHTNTLVTPSWGYGGTYIDAGDPSLCPGEHLVAYVGGTGSDANVIDLQTGEPMRVPFGSPDWIAAQTRKASVADLPNALRSVWPRDKHAGEADVLGTSWLLTQTNADYVALCELHARGVVGTSDHEREFMWAIMEADGSREGVANAIQRRLREGRWAVADPPAFIALHANTAKRLREERPSNATAAAGQLSIGF